MSNPDNPSQINKQSRYRGKLSDKLKFNVPDVSFGGEQAPVYQPIVDTTDPKADRISKLMDDLGDLLPGVVKAQKEEGKKKAQKGYTQAFLDRDQSRSEGAVEAMGPQDEELVNPDDIPLTEPVRDSEGRPVTTADGRPVTTFGEWKESNKGQWRELRKKGEVTLHDDPWFQEGYRKGKGELAQVQYRNDLLEWYEREKNNPNIYKTPEAFEEALKLRFDLAYGQLPQDTIVQEAFLKAIIPVQENIKAQYKTDLNEYEKQEFLIDHKGRTAAEMLQYRDSIDMIDSMTDEEAEQLLMSFPESFWEELIPRDATEFPEGVVRDSLKEFAYNDLIDGLDELGEELFHAQGEMKHGIGVNPTEARLEYIVESTEDPLLAMKIIRDVRAGSGSLGDTSRGKAVLADLAQKGVTYARTQAAREREDANRREAEVLDSLVRPIEDISADIATFEDVMREESMSAEQVRARLMDQIEATYGDDFPVERAKAEGDVKVAYRRATRPDSDSGPTQSELNRQAIKERRELFGVNFGMRPLDSRAMVSVANTEEEFINLNRSEYRRQMNGMGREVDSAYYENPDDETTQTRFWNTAGFFTEINQQQGLNLRMDSRYSSDAALGNSPSMVNTLRQANQRGVLGAFIDPDSEVGEAIQFLGSGAGMSEEQYFQAFLDERKRTREVAQEKAEETRSREDVDATLGSIPIMRDESVATVGFAELGEFIGGAGDVNLSPEILRPIGQLYLDYRANLMRDEGLGSRAATEKATEWLSDNVKFQDLGEHYDEGVFSIGSNTKVLLTPDSDFYTYNLNLADGSTETLAEGLEVLVNDLRIQQGSDFREGVALQLDDFAITTRNRVIDQMTGPEGIAEAQQTYFDSYTTSRGQELVYIRKAIDRIAETDKLGYGDDKVRAAFRKGASSYAAMMGDVNINDEGQLLAIIEAGLTEANGKGDPIRASRDALKEYFYETGYKAHTQRWKNEYKDSTRNRLRQELSTPEGIRPYLSQFYGDDIVNIYSDIEQLYSIAERSRPNATFDFNDELVLIPAPGDKRFLMQDAKGEILTTVEGQPLYIQKEDLGDRIEQGRRGRITSDMWMDIKGALGSDLTSVDDQELRGVLKDYFDDLPENLPLRIFREKFGAAGKYVYDIYRGMDR